MYCVLSYTNYVLLFTVLILFVVVVIFILRRKVREAQGSLIGKWRCRKLWLALTKASN